MKEKYLKEIERYSKKQSRQTLWYRIVTCLAAVVVFVTTYALILPAITLEKTCEIPVHTHSNACYTQVTSEKKKTPICTIEGNVAHQHDSFCYDEDGTLWCRLAEVEEHIHTETCYVNEKLETGENEKVGESNSAGKTETAGESDTTGETEAIAAMPKTSETSHVHIETCWVEHETLICGFQSGKSDAEHDAEHATESDAIKPHEHTETCYETVRESICGYPIKEDAAEETSSETAGNLSSETAGNPPGGAEENPLEETTAAPTGGYPSESETDRAVFCGEEELPVHQHTDGCFEIIEVPADTTVLTCENRDPDHEHTERCYGTWELTCGMEEHVHTSACMPDLLSEEEQARVDAVIERIDMLPTYEEIEAVWTSFEEAEAQDPSRKNRENDDQEYQKLILEIRTVYAYYEDLGSELQKYVTNSEKLMELEWLWSAQTLEIKDTVTVYQVNQYENAVVAIVYGGSVEEKLGDGMSFTYWNAVIVEKNDAGKLYVDKMILEDGPKLDLKATTSDGFVLLLYHETVQAMTGDEVRINFDYQSTSGYQSNGYGRVLFGKTEDLTTIAGADTRDLIEINLYDYGSNINEKYQKDANDLTKSKYPGFQQDGGTTAIEEFSQYSFNFGNNITSDLLAGTTGVTNGSGINSINSESRANRPISGAMLPTLQDGYPALADGTSLEYLFSDNTYATKKNVKSINGLFQYNEETGAYTFNSRENHAQFNSDDDTFTLYRQMITSNFMMYPFGNFLPFNDITSECTSAGMIDRTYFETIRYQAQQKAEEKVQQNAQQQADAYGNLASALNTFISKMDGKYPSGWTSADCINEYFSAAGISGSFGNASSFSETDAPLENLYSIDYDEPTDFYFGMEMKMNFMQPKDGLTGKDGKQPMKFYFTGDDDVWVYIDGVLFMDLSGIHRHVGGEIDFVNGEVKYYALDVATGDVSAVPYETKTFAQILRASGMQEAKVQELLEDKGNGNGPFKDYSNHTFNFYYMERGAGSGVCRMNFNLPLLRTISVKKSLRVDDSKVSALLGNPDFSFQILKENGTELFFGKDVTYEVLEQDGTRSAVRTTGKHGIFTLKTGQTAVFSGIQNTAGKYFVRELLDEGVFEQYGTVTVDGTSTVVDNYSNVLIDSHTFKGVNSPVKDAADGSTVFEFCNQVTANKLGRLSITKTLTSIGSTVENAASGTLEAEEAEEIPAAKASQKFDVEVTLDGKTQMISVSPGESKVIEHILAGTKFTVRETTESSKGYAVTYKLNGAVVNSDHVEGQIKVASNSNTGTGDGSGNDSENIAGTDVRIEIVNTEAGASISIPIQKMLEMPDGQMHRYSFQLMQVTDSSGGTAVEEGYEGKKQLEIQTEPKTDAFVIAYPKRFLEQMDTTSTLYYRIAETDQTEPNTQYDQSYYVVEVQIDKEKEGAEYSAKINKIYKNGVQLEETQPDGTTITISFTNAIRYYELPETGGSGTNVFIVGGVCMILIAVILFWYQKKMLRMR